ncbi:MAG: hypothetical protein IKF52_01415 [Clostridia bacterium]|nr:hypothetical protein [Clostridia bacterium]MBR3152198.1 hypothetical protein [Clostridia bacterium]MBR3152265.1 hypothetical protein [Clostridia bacterium]
MELENIDNKTFLAKGTFNNSNISKQEFMMNSNNLIIFINQIKNTILKKYNLTGNLIEKYTYIIKNSYYIYFITTNKNYYFKSNKEFQDFCNFIRLTKYKNDFLLDEKKGEINISPNIDNNIFYLLEEFT